MLHLLRSAPLLLLALHAVGADKELSPEQQELVSQIKSVKGDDMRSFIQQMQLVIESGYAKIISQSPAQAQAFLDQAGRALRQSLADQILLQQAGYPNEQLQRTRLLLRIAHSYAEDKLNTQAAAALASAQDSLKDCNDLNRLRSCEQQIAIIRHKIGEPAAAEALLQELQTQCEQQTDLVERAKSLAKLGRMRSILKIKDLQFKDESALALEVAATIAALPPESVPPEFDINRFIKEGQSPDFSEIRKAHEEHKNSLSPLQRQRQALEEVARALNASINTALHEQLQQGDFSVAKARAATIAEPTAKIKAYVNLISRAATLGKIEQIEDMMAYLPEDERKAGFRYHITRSLYASGHLDAARKLRDSLPKDLDEKKTLELDLAMLDGLIAKKQMEAADKLLTDMIPRLENALKTQNAPPFILHIFLCDYRSRILGADGARHDAAEVVALTQSSPQEQRLGILSQIAAKTRKVGIDEINQAYFKTLEVALETPDSLEASDCRHHCKLLLILGNFDLAEKAFQAHMAAQAREEEDDEGEPEEPLSAEEQEEANREHKLDLAYEQHRYLQDVCLLQIRSQALDSARHSFARMQKLRLDQSSSDNTDESHHYKLDQMRQGESVIAWKLGDLKPALEPLAQAQTPEDILAAAAELWSQFQAGSKALKSISELTGDEPGDEAGDEAGGEPGGEPGDEVP